MARATAILLFLTLLLSAAAYPGTLPIVPTTTLAAETGNNTSASNLFTATTNGDLGAGNVSKADMHSLVYPGFNGQIFAHMVGWFCMNSGSTATGAGTKCGSHIQIGYNSGDAAQSRLQVNDMISRGINGIFHDWYGKGSPSDNVAQHLIAEAQTHPGFTYSIMIDQGAIKWWSCYSTCTATQALTQIAQYVANTYFSSPAYLRVGGRPVLTSFGLDGFSIDWNYVIANTPGNPIWLFQNNGGFTHSNTGGAYSWVMPTDSNYGLDYLSSFYNTGLQYPSLYMVGATYKGFNDTLASWSANRIMSQQCGQTWLQTYGTINGIFNSSKQLDAVQLVTWDDYEEGTEIESGIDNCLTISGSMSGSVLNWSISGSESTLDHYTVFISTDGQNLMPLGDFTTGVHQLDLSTFSLAAGNYTLYVKAVGRPSIVNHMSGAVSYTVSAPPPSGPTAVLTLSANSGTAPVTITASTANSTDTSASITSSTITWGDGTSSAGPTASHTYSVAGSYTVTGKVTDSLGLSSSASQSVSIAAPPSGPTAVLTLSANSGTAPVTITASTANSTDSSASITSSTITWGDGTWSAGPTASHTYSVAGSYTVTGKVTDSLGLSSSASQAVSITAGSGIHPGALSVSLSLSTTNGAVPVTVTASTAASTDTAGTITSSIINWGDGASSAGFTASHIYSQPGVYTVIATLTDNVGNTASKSVAVNAAGVVISSPLPGSTSGSWVQVTARAVDANAVSAMYVYIDGKTKYSTSSNSLSINVKLKPGTHNIVIKAWEVSSSLVMQANTTVTVR